MEMPSPWFDPCNVEVFWAESWSLFWAMYVLYFQRKTDSIKNYMNRS